MKNILLLLLGALTIASCEKETIEIPGETITITETVTQTIEVPVEVEVIDGPYLFDFNRV